MLGLVELFKVGSIGEPFRNSRLVVCNYLVKTPVYTLSVLLLLAPIFSEVFVPVAYTQSHESSFKHTSDGTSRKQSSANQVSSFAAQRIVNMTLVSVSSDGTPGNNQSWEPVISSDGCYAAFRSLASNLVSNDTNGYFDVFVHDVETGETVRVSVASDGTEGNFLSVEPSISADGRYVAFSSGASNLVTGDTNGRTDIFVHDRETGQTARVSVASNGAEGNEGSFRSCISPDGRYVAFSSAASDLVTGDTNGRTDIFVHDRETGATTRVSVATDGTQGDWASVFPSISADGRYVSFRSRATTLVSDDLNGTEDAFVHDRETGETIRVSVASDGSEGNYGGSVSSISADGRYVAFFSLSGNLVSGDTNDDFDIFVHDLETRETSQVSVASDGTKGSDRSVLPGGSFQISADGRFVTFTSYSDNLVGEDTNRNADVFVHDRATGETFRVSMSPDGTEWTQGSFHPVIAPDGRFVAFATDSRDFVDTIVVPQVYVAEIDNSPTVVRSIVHGSDDAGPDAANCAFSTAHNEIYFGECGNGEEIVSGFHFQNIPISSPEEIESAYIEFTIDGPYSNDIHIAFRGEDADNSETFSDDSKPSDRESLTGHIVEWNLNSSDVWSFGEKRNSPDLTPIIKQIVDRPGWRIGNAISIIVKNVGSNGNHRRVFAFEREGSSLHAARLVVSFGHSISGQVTDDYGNPISSVTIADNAGHVTLTGEDGFYSLSGLPAGTYTIIPSKPFYTFEPSTPTISVPPGVAGRNFKATYDCSAGEPEPLSYIGKAVFNSLQTPQLYCNNSYDGLFFTPGNPPGYDTGFHAWADLARSAKVEVLFTNMGYDKPDLTLGKSPMEILADAIGHLYNEIKNTPSNYPEGLSVRILMGNPYPLSVKDDRFHVLNDLWQAGVEELENTDIGWKLEVAKYRGVPTHSHAKFMVVDGKTVLAAGFNLLYEHLAETKDFGVQVTGPVAQAALGAYDRLWEGSSGYYCPVLGSPVGCYDYKTIIEHTPEVKKVHVTDGEINAFSLFRTHRFDEKESDTAVKVALSAAKRTIDVMQVSFTYDNYGIGICLPPITLSDYMYLEPDYMKGLRLALEETNGNINIRILLSPKEGWQKRTNECGIKVFREALNKINPSFNGAVKFRTYTGQSHAKTVVIDGKFLIVGSQNWNFSGFGDLDIDTDLAEYNLAIDDEAAADDFLSFFNDFWQNESIEPKVVEEGGNIKATIENASDGDIISLYGDGYLISEPININSEITIIALGTILEPDASNSTKLVLRQQPLLRINASNVEIIGVVMKDALGYAIEIGDGSGKPLENISITNSVFENNALGGIKITQPVGNPLDYKIESNTFVGSSSGVTINVPEQQADTASVRHNIFAGQSVTPIEIVSEADGNVEYSYNLFYNCGTGGDCASNWHVGNLSSGSSEHDNLFDLDPVFTRPDTGDYRLRSGSPAIDAGDTSVVSGGIIDGDGDGVPLLDIGAFEYVPDSLLVSVRGTSIQRNLPKTFSLFQNYPNPFNASTKLRFGLPETANVKIEVFNILGQRAATMFDGWKSAGFHTLTFDAGTLASGIYMYRIQAGNFVEVKKMILMK